MSDTYALIGAEQADVNSPFTVTLMCRVLQVSRSSFYDWLTAQPSARQRRHDLRCVHVRAAFDAGRGAYGARRVHAVLTRSDDPQVASTSLKTVRGLLRELGLRACQPRAWRTTTLRDGADKAGIVDHLRRDFTAERPGEKLVGDITYLRTGQGWLYLATVIDCATRAVVGWSMAEHMRTSLICNALSMAATRVPFSDTTVFHSDRGTQYVSAEYARHRETLNVTGSMGRTGVCWDNALAESFFAALKNELVYRRLFRTREQARKAVAEYIEVFYNRQRLHSRLGYRTPLEATQAYQQNTALAA